MSITLARSKYFINPRPSPPLRLNIRNIFTRSCSRVMRCETRIFTRPTQPGIAPRRIATVVKSCTDIPPFRSPPRGRWNRRQRKGYFCRISFEETIGQVVEETVSEAENSSANARTLSSTLVCAKETKKKKKKKEKKRKKEKRRKKIQERNRERERKKER